MLTKTMMRKVMALTMLLILATNTFMPGMAYALTAGPTSPEATSFEPVDTTDMVNLQTGDFTYNIPLLEVPGPEGGYPLSLSYHAGIQPNVEASWVGLGWTLNPGAITRSVNGNPDDWNGATSNRQDYWEGGTTRFYSAGITIGYGLLPVNASVGLTFADDTYDGFGLESFSAGLEGGYSYDVGAAGSVGAKIGVSNTQGVYGSIGAQMGGASASVGASTNFQSIDGYATGSIGMLQASISSSGTVGIGIGVGEGGSISGSVVRSSQDAPVQTEVKSKGMNIPTPWYFSISLGYSKMRYWIDRSESITSHGSLYPSGWESVNNVGYDSYSLPEADLQSFVFDADPTKNKGGAFLEFDNYNVLAQGLGGAIRPYYFRGDIMDMNRVDASGNKMVKYMRAAPTASAPKFRFIGDFSNTYQQQYPSYAASSIQDNITNGAQPPPFDPNPVYGESSNPSYGYDGSNGLFGSRSIAVNQFLKPANTMGYDKNLRYKTGMIEGFSITNESGVTYHYALPAYCWNEEITQHKIDESRGVYLNRSKKSNPYAYTWYLTSITGPDFVDRPGPNGEAANGKADEGDWGYWVNFEYGKWSNNYSWRNPSEGTHRDEDVLWENCSMGKKEVYFLNAIRTRSHVALFEKGARYDGKGASPEIFNQVGGNGSNKYKYTTNGLFNNNSALNLKLDRVYLLNASDASIVTPSSATGNPYVVSGRNAAETVDSELPGNILETSDVNAIGRTVLEQKSIRIIDFNYDYSLCKRTVNSFEPGWGYQNKYGKLTLNSIKFLGKSGANILPATRFDYDVPAVPISGAALNGTAPATSAAPQIGEMFVTNDYLEQYVGVVVGVQGQPNGYTKYILRGGEVAVDNNKTYKATKNPPYNKDIYDYWGMFRGYVDPVTLSKNENLGRMVDPAAAKCADAWSMRKIVSATGAHVSINYEPDDYGEVAFNNSPSFIMSDFSDFVFDAGNNQYGSFTCKIQSEGYNLSNFISEGERVKFALLTRERQEGGGSVVDQPWPGEGDGNLEGTIHNINWTTGTAQISNVDRTMFVLRSSTMKYVKIVTGNLYIPTNKIKYGGGIRVQSLSIDDNDFKAKTTYGYTNINNTSQSSGVTSYEPAVFPILDWAKINSTTYPFPWGADEDHEREPRFQEIKNIYRKTLYASLDQLYFIARELPPPGVMYKYVTVTSSMQNGGSVANVPGKTVYEFETVRSNMVERKVLDVQQGNPYIGNDGNLGISNQYLKQEAINLVIKKFTSSIGTLKRRVSYDVNNKKLSETINHYLHDGLENRYDGSFFSTYKTRLSDFDYQGYIQERSSQVKMIYIPGNKYGVSSVLSAKEEYPCISEGTTTINYVNGTTTTNENLAFDFYSGAVTKTLSIDANGNRFIDSKVPAYRHYPEMGLKGAATNNKNMLTQTAASYSYRVNEYDQPIGLVGAAISTWSKTANVLMPDYGTTQQDGGHSTGTVWRPDMTYTWAPEGSSQNGMTAIGVFVDFNWGNQANPSAQNAGWIKTGQTTLYDVFSHALEASDMNEQYVATKMGYNHSKIMVSGGPAKYAEIAYSGAEDELGSNNFFNGDINIGGTINTNPSYVHTGAKSVKVVNGNGFQYEVPVNKLDNTRDYWASVWVKSGNGTPASNESIFYTILGTAQLISGQISSPNPQGWQLATIKIPASAITGGTLIVGCYNNSSNPVYFDDIRFHPLNAGINSYVYDNFSGELTYILDNNNFFTKFEYDAAGRLVKTFRETQPEGIRPVSEFIYNYAKKVYLSNPLVNWEFQKNDCSGANPVGSMVIVNIPAGQFNSVVSQLDADQKAMDEGQRLANLQGTCGPVYLRIENDNLQNWSGYDYFSSIADVYIRAYADPGYTQPYYGSVTLEYVKESGSHLYSGDGYGCQMLPLTHTPYTVTFSGEYQVAFGETLSYIKMHPITYDYLCEDYISYSISYY